MILIAMTTTVGGIWGAFFTDRSIFERVSLAITCLGVVVALVIYTRQGKDSQASEDRLIKKIDEERERSKEIAVEADSASDTQGEDAYPEATNVLMKSGVDMGDGYRLLPADEVPMQVLGDLLRDWKEDGKSGRWNLGALKWSVRKVGKGNHPWIVTFEDPDEHRFRSWKVSKGGQGKSVPSVSEIS